MTDRTPDQSELADFGLFIRNLTERLKSFDSFSYGLVLVRPRETDGWQLHLGTFDFCRTTEIRPPGRHEYPDLTLIRGNCSVREGVKCLEELMKTGNLGVGDEPVFSLAGHFQFDWNSTPSQISSDGALSIGGWSTQVLAYEASQQNYSPPYGPFVNAKEPPFASFTDAAGSWLFLKEGNYRLTNNRATLLFRLPDYRGRITGVRFGGDRLDLTVEGPGLSSRDLVAKVVIETPDGPARHTLELEGGGGSLPLPRDSRRVSAFLVHVQTNAFVDKRILDVSSAGLQSADLVSLELTEATVEALIARGENKWIEFKREMTEEGILESVVAFSNGEGGRVLIGVDDNGKPLGWFDEKAVQRIEGAIRGRIDPVPVAFVNPIHYYGKPLVIVTVPRGKNRPYVLLQRGPLIRSGSTDRAPTRAELDLLYPTRDEQRI